MAEETAVKETAVKGAAVKGAAAKKVTLNCNLKPDVARKFKAMCVLTGKKVPEVLEEIIHEHVKKSGKVTL